ncbi:MAG TPA: aminotransferase class I/II-fold pyridoxal phosphate-dependent enzyme, partial [Actinobacteria bacterium]|nr:aminotransferase class I/II-fold pyridoxal phosphate-dependent enzyme [Actinomycetota bacterium]
MPPAAAVHHRAARGFVRLSQPREDSRPRRRSQEVRGMMHHMRFGVDKGTRGRVSTSVESGAIQQVSPAAVTSSRLLSSRSPSPSRTVTSEWGTGAVPATDASTMPADRREMFAFEPRPAPRFHIDARPDVKCEEREEASHRSNHRHRPAEGGAGVLCPETGGRMAFADGTADFRSDTVTRPTAEMRRAMAEAEVGDDVYGEDPTVNALEQEAAAAVGKAAAVFTPTGSMANQLALNTLVRPGDEALCAACAHVRQYEVGAAAAISGVQFRTVDSRDGSILPEDVEVAVAGAGYHLPRVSLLVWENPLTSTGGTVIALEMMRATTAAARRLAIPVYLDGARIFNAA